MSTIRSQSLQVVNAFTIHDKNMLDKMFHLQSFFFAIVVLYYFIYLLSPL
jgi:hypothetical protein